MEFRLGFVEDLKALNISDNSVDVVISNCVVNLCADKKVIFKEIWRVLKEGGELYFSDMYADRRIPEAFQKDKVLWGEGLGGATYMGDFRRMMDSIGFKDYRVMKKSKMSIANKELE